MDFLGKNIEAGKIYDCMDEQKIKNCENDKAHLHMMDCENDAEFQSLYEVERKLQEKTAEDYQSKLFYSEIEMIYEVVLSRLY